MSAVEAGNRFPPNPTARDRLVQQGLLVYKDGYLTITPKGKQVLHKFEIKDFAIKRPYRWDKKWRVLIFDIPEHRRGLRDKIRITLSMVGFVHLQHSVWLYPYDCEELVLLLKADFKVGKDVLYLIVDALENDLAYRKHFKLAI